MDQATDSQVRISHRLDVEEKEEEEKEEEEEEGEEKEGVLFLQVHHLPQGGGREHEEDEDHQIFMNTLWL
ncbi:hypothetical protein V1477_000935 [Vespula maculifrons]|uniref:Uncharacterized protein n=1 Tax=Vespula maculifrons TaxID=7453 RepID=A0ABD2D0C5_VESMC